AVFGSWGKIRSRLEELSARYEGIKIILGLPVSSSGKPTELSAEVELFSLWLSESGFVVELINEVGSTVAAMQLLGKKDRKGRVDSLAACEILKRHLNLL
ncbi:MAG: Holliday junction resolvase RuvX, partial [Candidatus Fermentibacteria bacterium]|nr:Holliday junction resolvase RuvX [Candidatus Fermentibacteria bacterium]